MTNFAVSVDTPLTHCHTQARCKSRPCCLEAARRGISGDICRARRNRNS